MKLAYALGPGRGDTDLLLSAVAEALDEKGIRTCGVVQINSGCVDGRPCDMDVKVLPEGPVLRISQSLGKAARGCRLDPSALETAVGLVAASLGNGADVLIVNKFGKLESEGRGFRGLIADAMARDIPVLVGLNRLNEAAFQEFACGMAVELPPRRREVLAWLETEIGVELGAA